MTEESRIIKRNLKTLIKRFSKSDVVTNIEKNYSKDKIKIVNTRDIVENPSLKKVKIDPLQIEETCKSIQESGIFSPLIVRIVKDKFEVVLGFKKYVCCKNLNKETIPCIVTTMDEEEAYLLMLADEREHKNCNIYKEAIICQNLCKKYGYKKKDLAELLKQSISQVSNIVKLLNLPQSILDDLSLGKISYGHARTISRLPQEESLKIYELIKQNKMSVRDTERYVHDYENLDDETKYIANPHYISQNNQIILRFDSIEEYKKADKRIQKLIKKKKIVL